MTRRMTRNQQKLFFREWRLAWEAIEALPGRAGFPSDERDARLHLCAEALGRPVESTTDVGSRDEFERVMAAIWSWAKADKLGPQMYLQHSPERRCRYVAEQILREIGIEEHGWNGYLAAMARRICKRAIEDCTERDWGKVLSALAYTAGKAKRDSRGQHAYETQRRRTQADQNRLLEAEAAPTAHQPEGLRASPDPDNCPF